MTFTSKSFKYKKHTEIFPKW